MIRSIIDDARKVVNPMEEPKSPEEVLALHKLRRSDPQRYIHIANGWIKENPDNSDAYFGRHIAWLNMGEPRRALEDLSKVIELAPDPVGYRSRGDVYRHLGEYEKALEDYDHGEALDPAQWEDVGFGLLNQADRHARLGDEPAALACCGRLPEDFWTPSVQGAPAGGKSDTADRLRLLAAEARRGRP
jgi:tetratricopeptide (TPR) repeat protein